jgi:protein SCO1
MSLRSYWILIAAVAVGAALAGAWTARAIGPPSPRLESGTWLPRPRGVGPIALVDQRGAPFTAAQLSGRPSLLYFGLTHSCDVCAQTLAMLARVSRSGVVPHVRVIFVTLDPARDRPARLSSYVSAFDPGFVALTGSARQIGAFAARLGVGFERIDLPGADYTIEHTAVVYLLDASGRIVAIFTAPFDASRLEQDLGRAAPWLGAGSSALRRGT